MGRRNDIDWEAIERDYRAGQLSMREIAAKHKVAPSSVMRRSEKHGWTQDLTTAVQTRTKAKLLAHAKPERTEQSNATPAESAQRNAQQAEQAVEVAAAANVAVILSHRESIAKVRALVDGMLGELVPPEDAKGAKGVEPLAKRAPIVKQLAETLRIQISLERQAFNITDSAQDVTDPLNALLAELMKRRSALPIVEDE